MTSSPYTNLPKSTKLYIHPASADVLEKWRTVMKELADDLESEIEARRSGDLDRRIERDLIVVKEARVLLDEQEQGQ
jgi:NADPH-dependent 7-cyano-7-deazaguanine reductase QueF-like protein